MMKVKYW